MAVGAAVGILNLGHYVLTAEVPGLEPPFGIFPGGFPVAAVFVVSLARGVLVQRSRFCVFGLVNLVGYRHGAEYPGALFLVGGAVQAVGYALGRGCPLTLLVRLGEGSRFHLAVFAGFLVGVGLYTGLLARPVEALLGPLTWTGAQTIGALLR